MTSLELIKHVIPSDVVTAQNSVADEWERFVGTGNLQKNNLRPVIADSWLRCREIGINPLEERAKSVISTDEIDSKLHCENLGRSGMAVLDRMANTVRDTGHIIVLADRSGKILYSVGHHQVQDHLEKINFRPGSEWNEKTVGPNGVGTPLALGQAELVMGTEHYCQGWQPWVCYGAPIHNPGNYSVLGCIDITGSAKNVSVEAMALAISIAHTVESELTLLQLKKREAIRSYYQAIQHKYPTDASLIVDDYGYIIDINSQARKLLNLSSQIVMLSPLELKFPDFWDFIKDCQKNYIEKEYKLQLENNLSPPVDCIVKPVKVDATQAGAVILFTSGRPVNIDNEITLRAKEDDLIRKTLLKTGGNISKAAKILNIHRSTIYRRKKDWKLS